MTLPRSPRKPTALIVLDGFGDGPADEHNAIHLARPAFFRWMEERFPRGQLITSGECVGLPAGQMGNSEVGHMNLGAGRIVWQDITRIDVAIRDGGFTSNAALRAAAAPALAGGRLHLMGLVSNGGVHSSDRHLIALLELYARLGVPADRVVVHAFLDGRDTPPNSALGFVAQLEEHLAAHRHGRIGSVIGRYFAMDRDTRWDRVEKAYRCLVEGIGEEATTGRMAVESAYARGESDEFVLPTVVGPRGEGRIASGDSVLFFNFRADRARELTLALMDPAFDGFAVATPRPLVAFTSLTRYRSDFPSLGVADAFPPQSFSRILTQVMASNSLHQLRIAETEKYAHVTYFFSGGVEEPVAREERVMIPSPKVATYDLQPEMSAPQVAERLVAEIERDVHDLIVLNLANPDMVGHTGMLGAAVEAIRAVDHALARIVPEILKRDGTVLLTADHGNCEKMWDEESNCPHTAHTLNPVPLILAGERFRGARLREGGILADVSPTLLEIMDLPCPPEMDRPSLLARD
jgi:2,3-bisphosphoglycerate-independent phosphoglycerate mutase